MTILACIQTIPATAIYTAPLCRTRHPLCAHPSRVAGAYFHAVKASG